MAIANLDFTFLFHAANGSTPDLVELKDMSVVKRKIAALVVLIFSLVSLVILPWGLAVAAATCFPTPSLHGFH